MSALGDVVLALSLLRAAVLGGDAARERSLAMVALEKLSAGPWAELTSVKVLVYALQQSSRHGGPIADIDVWSALDDVVALGLEMVTPVDDEPTYVPDGSDREPTSDTDPCPAVIPAAEMACWSAEPRDSDAVALGLEPLRDIHGRPFCATA